MKLGCDYTTDIQKDYMDKKTLLAAATRKLERRPEPATGPQDAESSQELGAKAEAPGPQRPKKEPATRKAEPVVSKGITLRPANVEKLDRLELSLRKQGIKAGHSGLIQIAIELLEDNAQLAVSYRELLKLDLRLK